MCPLLYAAVLLVRRKPRHVLFCGALELSPLNRNTTRFAGTATYGYEHKKQKKTTNMTPIFGHGTFYQWMPVCQRIKKVCSMGL